MGHREQNHTFAEELDFVLTSTDTSVRRLSRLTGVPRRTLENWLYGRVVHPRAVEPILQVAHALHLPAEDTDRLLQSAGHPPLADLAQQAQSLPPGLLRDWLPAPEPALPSHMPATSTPFLGREQAQHDLATLLRRPDSRLVTITGIGGVGKTRLALEMDRMLRDAFAHGICFVALENVDGSEAAWAAITEALRLPNSGEHALPQLIREYLSDKELLLILDNYEHLLPDTSLITDLLAVSQRLALLVTSREALDLRAEQRFALGGLSFAAGRQSPAYRLFLETARRRVPHYEVGAGEAEDITALCTAVDGLPLAVELAATWSDVLSPAQTLAHIRGDLSAVGHAAADRPARHHNLWNLFDFSWQMLQPAEQAAALRLATVHGSMAATVALNVSGTDAAVLKQLVRASIVRHTAGSRLLLHPLMAQFLRRNAVATGHDLRALEDNFMAAVLGWTAVESGLLRSTFNVRHFLALHGEWQHIERAWALAVDRGRTDLLEACWDLLAYFEVRGTWAHGLRLFAAARAQIPESNRRFHARLDEAEAFCYLRLNDLPRTLTLAQRALHTLSELDTDPQDVAGRYARVVLFSAQYVLDQQGIDEAGWQRLRRIYGEYFRIMAEITCALSQGVNYYTAGDFESAVAAFQRGLEVGGPDAYTIAANRCFLGQALRRTGQTEQAREQIDLAFCRARELQLYPPLVAAAFERTWMEHGDAPFEPCRAALESLADEIGSRRVLGWIATTVAVQYLNLYETQRARQIMRIGAGLIWPDADNAERRRALATIARAYLAFGLIKNAPQVLKLVLPNVDERLLI